MRDFPGEERTHERQLIRASTGTIRRVESSGATYLRRGRARGRAMPDSATPSRPPLVGREHELSLLLRGLEDARRGHGTLVWIERRAWCR